MQRGSWEVNKRASGRRETRRGMSPNKHKTVIKKQNNNNRQLDGRTETRIQSECYRAFTRQPSQYPDYTEIKTARAVQTFHAAAVAIS
jgi:predicted P-loop ATPase